MTKHSSHSRATHGDIWHSIFIRHSDFFIRDLSMETSLHRQLKALYAGPDDRQEVKLGGYRIDVVRGKELVEIQHGSLAAIRDKVQRLCKKHDVLVVKPVVARKTIIRLTTDGLEESRRQSPKRGCLLDIFDELVYFTRAFPHRRLTLELRLVEIEEERKPGHGRRRRWRRNDHVVVDQRMTTAGEPRRVQTAADLLSLLPAPLPSPFHTAELAALADVPRGIAQRIAYCLREMGAVETIGKKGNALLYRVRRGTHRRRRNAA